MIAFPMKTPLFLRAVPPGLFLCLFSLTVHAQSSSDGSIYSRFGLGERWTFNSSQLQGMGGGGTGLQTFQNLNLSNPASWSSQVLTRVAVGMRYEGLEASDASNQTSRLSSGVLNGVQISFPLKPNKLGVGIGFLPYSRVSYRVENAGQLTPDPALEDTSSYLLKYKGNGGLQRIVGGMGYKFNRNLSLGVNADFIFGIIEESQRTTFFNSAFQESNLRNATRLSGITATIGALGWFPNILDAEDALSVGVSFTLPTTLTGTRVETLGEAESADTLGGELSGNTHLPMNLGVGVAYTRGSKWTILADARFEPWSRFDSDYTFPGFTPGHSSTFEDRVRLSAGFEFLPAGGNLLASYIKRVAYRFGFYYDTSYTRPVRDVTIRTYAVTGGLSLPTLVPGTRLDINLEVGTRGTTDNGLVRDMFYRVGATLNFGELWFSKRKLG